MSKVFKIEPLLKNRHRNLRSKMNLLGCRKNFWKNERGDAIVRKKESWRAGKLWTRAL
jgi:hypothetical protein